MRPVSLIVLCVLLTGCSSLIIRDQDSIPVVTGKVAARTVNCVLTIWMLCASEWLAMEEVKEQEAFNAWWQSASTEERQAYLTEQERRRAAVLPLLYNQMYLNQQQQMLQDLQRQQQQQTIHCNTYYYGNQAQTTCR